MITWDYILLIKSNLGKKIWDNESLLMSTNGICHRPKGVCCYLIKLHVASKYPTHNDLVLECRVTVCPISWVYYVGYSQTVVSHRVWQGWTAVLLLNGLFVPTLQRKCNMNSCPVWWTHSFLITCPSHHLLRILDALMMSWLDLDILTNGKLLVTPTPLHWQSMRKKFLSPWKW